MANYDCIDKIDMNRDFKYKTTCRFKFDMTSYIRDSFDLLNGNGKVIAECRDGILNVPPGYMWDGCTSVGSIIPETYQTLVASMAHDILYIAKKDKPDALKYSLTQADKYFRELMQALYAAAGKSSIRPFLYYYGIKLFGGAYKKNSVPGYSVVVK